MSQRDASLFLPSRPPTLCASVLEPDLHLALREVESVGKPGALRRGEVLGRVESLLQFPDLVSGERGSALLGVFLVFSVARLVSLALGGLRREGVGGDWGDGVRVWGVDESRGVAHSAIVHTVTHVGIVSNYKRGRERGGEGRSGGGREEEGKECIMDRKVADCSNNINSSKRDTVYGLTNCIEHS
jgi:hypothetical protein